MKANVAGIFQAVWSISFTVASGTNKEVEGSVMVDNVINTQATGHRKITTASDTGCMGGTCLLDLSAGQVVSLGVLNETDTVNVNVEHANLSLK